MSSFTRALIVAVALTGLASAQAFNEPAYGGNVDALDLIAPVVAPGAPVTVGVQATPGACVTLILTNAAPIESGFPQPGGLLLIDPFPSNPFVVVDTSVTATANASGGAVWSFYLPASVNIDYLIMQACVVDFLNNTAALTNRAGILFPY